MAAPFAMSNPRGVEKEDWPVVDVSDLKATVAYIKTLTQQLPEDDGIPMETRRHQSQMVLLIHSLVKRKCPRGRRCGEFASGEEQNGEGRSLPSPVSGCKP